MERECLCSVVAWYAASNAILDDTHTCTLDFFKFTGDHVLIARNTALQLDMGDKIFTAERLPMLDPHTKEKPSNLSATYGDLCLVADGFAQVYPEHKYLIVECLREMGYVRSCA
jgi:H+-transporting ATPase